MLAECTGTVPVQLTRYSSIWQGEMTGTPDVLTLDRSADDSLVEQIVRAVELRIEDHVLRAGARMPSIRQFAEQHDVSRFTVVEAYDRLVARGLLESRRGSGFTVRERAPAPEQVRARIGPPTSLDITWLIRNMFRVHPLNKMPGAGLLPTEWLDGDVLSGALRAVSRQSDALLHYGTPQGFPPLRAQLQLKLAALGIEATPDRIVTTLGVTQGLDLLARVLLRPGDVVFVDDPAWFLMFGSFARLGLTVIGVPRLADGPDIARLTELVELHRPKLYVISSVLHNPTSTCLSAAKAFQVLRLAEQHDFTIAEDDIYCDLHADPGRGVGMRISALDQLSRTVYLGGYSKTLAGTLRVGFLACNPDLAQRLTDQKMLSTLTTSEISERVVHQVLSEGHYRKHVDRLRGRLDGVREQTMLALERVGLKLDNHPTSGMFVWADAGCDTNVLTQRGLEKGFLFAPGSLFSPRQLPSTRTRINVACMADPGVLAFLDGALG